MPPAEQRASMPYCIALQPICDAKLNHVADELLYRASSGVNHAVVDDPLTATARVCNAAFYETGVEALCGKRKLFFNAPRGWLLSPELLPPNPEQVVVEVLESVEGDAEILAALHEVKARGYTLALDDFVLTPATRPLLELADIIKLDMLEQPPKPGELDEYLSRGITLLAEKVEDKAGFDACREMGFSLFQGYFYARPEVKQATAVKRGRNQSAQLQLLGELQKNDVDYTALEKLLAQDPQLCIRLLRLINSACYRRVNEITSLRQALALLGVDRLRSLVTTLVLANDDPCNMLLLPQTLTRAAMCEQLAAKEYNEAPDSAFMTGLLSMAHLLMDLTPQELCDQLPLSDAIKMALIDRAGNLGKILRIVVAHEQASFKAVSDQTIARLNHYYLSSRSWANSVLIGLDEDPPQR